jgi:preprotein translocase subunit YajC
VDGVARALPYVLVLLVGYVLIMRPLRKRAKETSALQSMLSPGDQVMLTSGIFGEVESILDDKITVEIAPDVVVTVHRGAIGKIVRDEPAVGDDDLDAEYGDELDDEYDDELEETYLSDDGVDHDYPVTPVAGTEDGLDPGHDERQGQGRPDTEISRPGGATADGDSDQQRGVV